LAKIRRLDPVLSSQIAAGEVVERPASVVKELVENALDASASRIVIEFADGGLSSICVFDDGVGMSREDARLSVTRFATSKIRLLSDLTGVSTLGFRGEALPSIASCSRLSIATNDGLSNAGIVVKADGGVVTDEIEAGLPKGTTVTVENLFYNTPARLKFVKSKTSERRVILDTVQRLALAWPEVSFTVRSEGKEIFKTGGLGLRNALSDIFGPDVALSMVPVDYSQSGIHITGFIGQPNLYRRTRDRMYFSVLKRPVKSIELSFALDDAFRGIIPPNSHAMAVLNIAVPPDNLDVNVHPTKTEVRFTDERSVRIALMQAARSTLRASDILVPQNPFKPDTHFSYPNPRAEKTVPNILGLSRKPQNIFAKKQDNLDFQIWQQPERVKENQSGTTSLPDGWQYLGSFLDTYLICSTPSSVSIIDKHALMESLSYMELQKRESGRQELLVSEVVKLDPMESESYEHLAIYLERLGFSSRLIGERTVLVTAVPLVLGKPLPATAIKEILSQSGVSPSDKPERVLMDAQLKTAACHASVRARESLSRDEAIALINQLIKVPEARTCPHGRPTVKEIGKNELNRFFGRTSHSE
jgi:DNA mismatch repair protein MutL